MNKVVKKINNQTLILDYRKFIFWVEESIILLSDLHIGKVSHFNKNGIFVPKDVSFENLKILKSGIQDYGPKEILFLGDLFHSSYNHEWEEWLDFFNNSKLIFTLILGNHDKINFKIENLNIFKNLIKDPFYFSHIPCPETLTFNICGHIHPAFKIRGKARQSIKLPCYFMTLNQLILPSFGQFTGSHIIDLKSTKDEILVVSKNQIFKV